MTKTPSCTLKVNITLCHSHNTMFNTFQVFCNNEPLVNFISSLLGLRNEQMTNDLFYQNNPNSLASESKHIGQMSSGMTHLPILTFEVRKMRQKWEAGSNCRTDGQIQDPQKRCQNHKDHVRNDFLGGVMTQQHLGDVIR